MPTEVIPKVGEYRQDILEQDGLRWLYGKGSGDNLTVNHEMLPRGNSIHDYICAQFAPGVVFLDVGAHVGHYTVRAAAAGCDVHAVEANPECVAQLRLNLHINKLSATIWGFAAWDIVTPLEFFDGPRQPTLRNGSSSLAGPASNPVPKHLAVIGYPLDSILMNFDKLHMVKMDVEGADLHVMDGMIASLEVLRPLLILEDHEFTGCYTREEMAAREDRLASRCGYQWAWATELGVGSAERFRVGWPPR